MNQQIRHILHKLFGHWQYNPYNSFRHHFAFSYFTGPYVFPAIPLIVALKRKLDF